MKESNIFNADDAGTYLCPVGFITDEVCRPGTPSMHQGYYRYDMLKAALCRGKMVITTNLLSRGIHFTHIGIVVNFDLPVNQSGEADYNTYLNRIGRTGRFGKRLSLVSVDSNCKYIQFASFQAKKESLLT